MLKVVPRQLFLACLALGMGALAVVLPSQAVDFVVERITDPVNDPVPVNAPVFVTAPPQDFERLFIVEQHSAAIVNGNSEPRIRILNLSDNSLNTTDFLQLTGVADNGEQGLLGLAFHPDYATNGYFYVNYTEANGATNVDRYQVSTDPDVADPNSRQTVIVISQPVDNHNGGWIGFGPDGFLYVALGDGGGKRDSGEGHTEPGGNAQDIKNNLLGAILRLDVDGDDFPGDDSKNYAIPGDNPFVDGTGDDEIWAYGLRNPWRCSFDRLNGDFYIGDVGQSDWEEINIRPAASSGAFNYGWRLREGLVATPVWSGPDVGGPKPPGAIDPAYNYANSGPYRAVVGGYVYRGPAPSLQGLYFFADYSAAEIWSFRFDGSDPSTFDATNFSEFKDWSTDFTPDEGSLMSVSSFGEDARGNLYIVDLLGEQIFRVPEASMSACQFAVLLAVLGVYRESRTRRRRNSAETPPNGDIVTNRYALSADARDPY